MGWLGEKISYSEKKKCFVFIFFPFDVFFRHGADSNVPKDQAHAHADLQALAEMCSNNVQFAGQHAQLCSNAVQNKNQKRSTQE